MHNTRFAFRAFKTLDDINGQLICDTIGNIADDDLTAALSKWEKEVQWTKEAYEALQVAQEKYASQLKDLADAERGVLDECRAIRDTLVEDGTAEIRDGKLYFT